jgi:type IV secretory pathway TrbL component
MIQLKNQFTMKASVKSENHIFLFAFLGALLFIAAIGFIIANFANMATSQLNLSGAIINGCSSLFFLYKAIKKDRKRIK